MIVIKKCVFSTVGSQTYTVWLYDKPIEFILYCNSDYWEFESLKTVLFTEAVNVFKVNVPKATCT